MSGNTVSTQGWTIKMQGVQHFYVVGQSSDGSRQVVPNGRGSVTLTLHGSALKLWSSQDKKHVGWDIPLRIGLKLGAWEYLKLGYSIQILGYSILFARHFHYSTYLNATKLHNEMVLGSAQRQDTRKEKQKGWVSAKFLNCAVRTGRKQKHRRTDVCAPCVCVFSLY